MNNNATFSFWDIDQDDTQAIDTETLFRDEAQFWADFEGEEEIEIEDTESDHQNQIWCEEYNCWI